MDTKDTTLDATESTTFMNYISAELLYSPVNLALLSVILLLVYKILRDRFGYGQHHAVAQPVAQLPELKGNFTRRQLAAYDGTQPDGRVLLGCNNTIFDVTKGKQYYGPGGPYAAFAGRDATRNLAKFDVSEIQVTDELDVSDLTPMEIESVNEWEGQFRERYPIVGKIILESELELEPDNAENAAVANETGEQLKTAAAVSTENKKDN